MKDILPQLWSMGRPGQKNLGPCHLYSRVIQTEVITEPERRSGLRKSLRFLPKPDRTWSRIF